MNLSHGNTFRTTINTTSSCSHSQLIVTAAATTMTSLKCIPAVLLLVALLTMMVFQITSLGLHIADLIGKREDQQNGEVKQLLEEDRNRTQEELNRLKDVIAEVKENTTKLIENELNSFAAKLQETELTLCNISSFNWRRVAYINMTDPEAECPSGLNEVSNRNTGQRACGRSVGGAGITVTGTRGCSSVTFPVNTTYSHVCGIARGYQYGTMEGFHETISETIDKTYVDGLSITRGSPRQHLWTLAVGSSEESPRCPRDQDPFNFRHVKDFVGDHFYCETGFTKTRRHVTAWSDPLWDGAGCVADTAHSCDRHGWFHREIEPTQDDIEVRWCSDQKRNNEDVYTDLLDIWVL